MQARTEVLGDRTIGREELLSVAWGLKSRHALFSLARGLMGVLDAVVEISMLPMIYTLKQFTLSRSVARELIGDDHTRDGGEPIEQFTKELLRGPLISAPLD